MMMINTSSNNLENQTTDEPTSNEPIITTSTPMWKLYENPFYHPHQHQLIHNPRKQFSHLLGCHHISLPITARKLATSFWNVRFIGPVMDSELNRAKAQIIELKAELEFERKSRKKMESANKKLVRELSEERKGREALERFCQELEKKVSAHKSEMSKMEKEIEEERKMLRMAEVFREERVQMKLTEAKFLLEEKILELEQTKQNQNQTGNFNIPSISKPKRIKEGNENSNPDPPKSGNFSREEVKYAYEEKLSCNCDRKAVFFNQRKRSPEPENPHIKRGIKGFVEFPRVVRAIGSRNRHLGTKLECQKVHLSLLLKQKSPIRSNNLIMS